MEFLALAGAERETVAQLRVRAWVVQSLRLSENTRHGSLPSLRLSHNSRSGGHRAWGSP